MDYKGGELGTPYMNESLESLITQFDDLNCKLVKDGDFSNLSDEQLLDKFWEFMEEIDDVEYSSNDETVYKYYQTVPKEVHYSLLKELSIKDMKKICDPIKLLKLIKQWS
jgi:hypothetical protein